MRTLSALGLGCAVLLGSADLAAFCGFYVSGADAKLTARASNVVLMRDGTKTVLSMQSSYEGPPEDFAMVIPVPVVLEKENVRTLPRALFAKVDQLAAPRLVEYWEQDPCFSPPNRVGLGAGKGAPKAAAASAAREGADSPPPAVTVEAKFDVDEYQIVILSSTDAMALETWLRNGGYKIPAGAEAKFRPYVEAGMKFFVAKVDPKKITFENGRALLSPLRVHYDDATFRLPIRLGLINAQGSQDLFVHILAKNARFEVANRPNVAIPTNVDVRDSVRKSFGSFYASLFDATLEKHKGAVVTEYAWSIASCDPCPGPTLTAADIAALGGEVAVPPRRSLTFQGAQSSLPNAQVAVGHLIGGQSKALEACVAGHLPPIADGTRPVFEVTIDGQGTITGVTPTAESSLVETTARDCLIETLMGQQTRAAGPAKITARFMVSASSDLWSWVLTRLHTRYSAESTPDDLVFKTAAPIAGGQERRRWSVDSVQLPPMPQEATLASNNSFQARYVIRHPWTGPIACEKPVRGRWGKPPTGETWKSAEAAKDLAFVKRGGPLLSMVSGALPAFANLPTGGTAPLDPTTPPPPALPPKKTPLGPIATEEPPPASTSSEVAPGTASGCGCWVGPGADVGFMERAGLGVFALALFGVRRKRRASKDAR